MNITKHGHPVWGQRDDVTGSFGLVWYWRHAFLIRFDQSEFDVSTSLFRPGQFEFDVKTSLIRLD